MLVISLDYPVFELFASKPGGSTSLLEMEACYELYVVSVKGMVLHYFRFCSGKWNEKGMYFPDSVLINSLTRVYIWF